MPCEGNRCVEKKRALGPVVWVVDKKKMCATCFERWMELSTTMFDQHVIVRFDGAEEKDFEVHKGLDSHLRQRRMEAAR